MLKKSIKAVCSCISCFLITALFLVQTFSAGAGNAGTGAESDNNGDLQLRFNDSGKFKIMVIADIQDGKNVNEYTLKLITKSIEAESPDLIVLNGDNIMGIDPLLVLSPKNVRNSIDELMKPITDSNIPFAVVFGNHDAESIMSTEKQMEYFQTFPNCYAIKGEAETGVGNYNILLSGSSDGEVKFNLWFFDTGNHAFSEYGYGYNYVREDQIKWYEDKSAEINAAYGRTVQSLAFQHIPVAEIYDLLLEAPESEPGAVKGHGKWSDKYYVLNQELVSFGDMNEGPCPPDYNNGQFASWKNQGNIMAAFFGHDHVNEFIGTLDGIDLCYVPGVGFASYGNGYKHGVRVIELDESMPDSYTTRMLYYQDLFTDTIPEDWQFDGEFEHSKRMWIYYGLAIGLAVLVIVLITLLVRKIVKRVRRNKLKKQNSE